MPVSAARSVSCKEPAAAVRAILCAPDGELDYLQAKLALDAIVDPATDIPTLAAELQTMGEKALRLAGPAADDGAKLNALRRLIYRERAVERLSAVRAMTMPICAAPMSA